MSKMKQKDAVYQAVCAVTGFNGDGSVEISKEQRAQVNAILFEGFKAGKIELDKEYTDSDLKGYVSGLQSNWLRKDERLNGGVKYTAKNPGSRAGSGDPAIKAMRVLLSTLTPGTADHSEVQAEIDKRNAEIQATKVKTIDLSALPEHLRAKFSV